MIENLELSETSSTSLTYSWSPPDCALRGGLLLHYSISLTDVEREEIILTTTIQTNTYIATGLTPYRLYGLRVTYVASKGSGPQSDRLDGRTNQDGKKEGSLMQTIYLEYNDRLLPCSVHELILNHSLNCT